MELFYFTVFISSDTYWQKLFPDLCKSFIKIENSNLVMEWLRNFVIEGVACQLPRDCKPLLYYKLLYGMATLKNEHFEFLGMHKNSTMSNH